MSAIYSSASALVPVEKLLAEASSAINDKSRDLASSEIPEILGAVGGVGAGVAAGAGILSAGAASGTAGAAAMTSGLAAAGGIVGGGMMSGLAVVAAPAVVLGIVGFWAISSRNRRKLMEVKEAMLQEALRKRDALLRELEEQNATNEQRLEYLSRLVIQLKAVIDNLQADLKEA